ncbi:MAG: glycosyltransferase [Bacteroidales bacterium]|nr:glycosyltransferase [Bacteroidales bacterium]
MLSTTLIILIVALGLLLIIVFIGSTCALRPLRRTGSFAPDKNELSPENPISSSSELLQVSDASVATDAENEAIGATDEAIAETSAEEMPQATESRYSRTDISFPSSDLPPVSVIVYAQCNEERLNLYLHQIMAQDYPAFEVILIFDGGAEAAADMKDILTARYPNICITFVPSNSHNLSRRKLAWTLGMKRASHDVVLTTAANCEIPSGFWLRQMLTPMTFPGVDVVLGATRFDFSELTGPGKWYNQFDRVIANASWINSALTGKPYRGDCYNMVFRRKLFFDINGYAATIGKPYGDDDIFVGQITNDKNTRVVISPETLLTMDWGVSTGRVRISLKEQQMSAAKELPRGPFIRRGLLSTCMWLTLILAAAIITCSLLLMPPELPWPAIAAAALLLLFWGLCIASYRKAATALQAIRLWWSVPVFMLWRPIANLFFRWRHRKANFMDFIWNGYE